MLAPRRFSDAVRAALEAELPQLRPAVLRARFHLKEEGDPADVVATLERIRRRGSHGILLKAPDHPLVAAAVDELAAAGVPTVTLVTDVPDEPSGRVRGHRQPRRRGHRGLPDHPDVRPPIRAVS